MISSQNGPPEYLQYLRHARDNNKAALAKWQKAVDTIIDVIKVP